MHIGKSSAFEILQCLLLFHPFIWGGGTEGGGQEKQGLMQAAKYLPWSLEILVNLYSNSKIAPDSEYICNCKVSNLVLLVEERPRNLMKTNLILGTTVYGLTVLLLNQDMHVLYWISIQCGFQKGKLSHPSTSPPALPPSASLGPSRPFPIPTSCASLPSSNLFWYPKFSRQAKSPNKALPVLKWETGASPLTFCNAPATYSFRMDVGA